MYIGRVGVDGRTYRIRELKLGATGEKEARLYFIWPTVLPRKVVNYSLEDPLSRLSSTQGINAKLKVLCFCAR